MLICRACRFFPPAILVHPPICLLIHSYTFVKNTFTDVSVCPSSREAWFGLPPREQLTVKRALPCEDQAPRSALWPLPLSRRVTERQAEGRSVKEIATGSGALRFSASCQHWHISPSALLHRYANRASSKCSTLDQPQFIPLPLSLVLSLSLSRARSLARSPQPFFDFPAKPPVFLALLLMKIFSSRLSCFPLEGKNRIKS